MICTYIFNSCSLIRGPRIFLRTYRPDTQHCCDSISKGRPLTHCSDWSDSTSLLVSPSSRQWGVTLDYTFIDTLLDNHIVCSGVAGRLLSQSTTRTSVSGAAASLDRGGGRPITNSPEAAVVWSADIVIVGDVDVGRCCWLVVLATRDRCWQKRLGGWTVAGAIQDDNTALIQRHDSTTIRSEHSEYTTTPMYDGAVDMI